MTPEELKAMTIDERKAIFAEAQARAVAAFPYQCIAVPGMEALGEWARLRKAGQYMPVIVRDETDLGKIKERYSSDDPAIFSWLQEPGRSVLEILEVSASLQLPADLKRRRIVLGEPAELPPLGPTMAPPARRDRIPHVLSDFRSGDILREVYLILVPAPKSYEIPAYLKWHAFNYSPPTEFHVAILKTWHERFGAELVGIGNDFLEVIVKTPPKTLDEAIQLAEEEYFYCPENINDRLGTLSERAAELMVDSWWFFWWD